MLKGKTAIVTGGSRGIGRAIALKLAKEGANVAILYCGSEEKAKETVQEAATFGVTANCYRCDVASEEDCKTTIEQMIAHFGSVDILVNNAGITRDMLMLQMKEEDFTTVLDTNLKGAYHMIRYCYRPFMKQKHGKIINITSVSGIMGNAGQTNYSASKAGLIGLTKSVAKELAGRNICCNAVAPGFVETEMTEQFKDRPEVIDNIPAKRMGKPEEVAALVAFLADDCSDYITGEVIRIDGGLAM
ncbi:MAG: 3-oxoacyl-[acyl-carrier-protein] reductase [Ruminococcaceae bacterium]|nr:3-oxoacyl-[acyl-carrier-protein] reductase [Oscillospiraceae bacterium]